MSKAILIQADNWEGLFVDGNLVEEGHTLNRGISRIKYFNQLAKRYNFKISALKEVYIDERDEDRLYNTGNFPMNLCNLLGDYENIESAE